MVDVANIPAPVSSRLAQQSSCSPLLDSIAAAAQRIVALEPKELCAFDEPMTMALTEFGNLAGEVIQLVDVHRGLESSLLRVKAALYNVPCVGEQYDQQHSDTHMKAALDIEAALQALAALTTGPLSPKNQFSVIGHDESSRELFVEHVVAEDGRRAFAAAAARRPDAEFSVAVSGHLREAEGGIAFPGESLVSAETIQEQTDVFGDAPEDDTRFRMSR